MSLQKFPFDPASETIGPSVSLLRGSRSIESPNVSPDGEWVVFRSRGRQEDLFVVRSDGTRLRQLTDDSHKDRGPKWSPDGSRIAFYSNRVGGHYDIWTIHPDGGGLTQLTRTTGPGLWFPNWSPDGKRLAIPDGTTSYLVDLGKPIGAAVPEPLPPPPEQGRWFYATSWSPDGRILAGELNRVGVFGGGVALFSIESHRYERLTTTGRFPEWLADGRRLLYWNEDNLLLLDTKTRRSRVLASDVRVSLPGAHLTLSKDNRWLYIITSDSEGDIWLATLE
jgi:Tol biopolymer transport system component